MPVWQVALVLNLTLAIGLAYPLGDIITITVSTSAHIFRSSRPMPSWSASGPRRKSFASGR